MTHKSDRQGVYVVAWDDALLYKIGYTSCGRYRDFVRQGARLVSFTEIEDVTEALAVETAMQQDARQIHPRAFDDRTQAIPFLGGTGGGWTECFTGVPND